ncbi:MAG TPA: DNA topoisomerase IB [Fontimonas sp.]
MRARLRHSSDGQPGWRRVRRGPRFVYLNSRGQRITSPQALTRIRRLAIPPAYEEVWICADALGHLQFTGRDARGRKQYRYHAIWRESRDRRKFSRVRRLGLKLPAIRRRMAKDLRSAKPGRNKAIATALTLLDLTGLRVGNRAYLRENGTYGLTTLRGKHLRLDSDGARLEFRGKGGIKARVEIREPALIRILRRSRSASSSLLGYRTANGQRDIDAAVVNARLQEWAGEAVTAKDFRTWTANVRLLKLLRRLNLQGRQDTRGLRESIAQVAAELGNTPAVCRRAYVDPALIDAYSAGELGDLRPSRCRGLRIDERRYLAVNEAQG